LLKIFQQPFIYTAFQAVIFILAVIVSLHEAWIIF
jgi:hypothetical protein